MGEEPLSPPSFKSADAQIYRLLIVPSFSSPLVLRLGIRADGTSELVTKVVGVCSGGRTHVEDQMKEISQEETSLFFQKLGEAKFWSMPSRKPEDPDPRKRVIRVDGTGWVLEGTRGGKYHLVARSSLEPREFADLLDMLMRTIGKLDERSLPNEPRNP